MKIVSLFWQAFNVYRLKSSGLACSSSLMEDDNVCWGPVVQPHPKYLELNAEVYKLFYYEKNLKIFCPTIKKNYLNLPDKLFLLQKIVEKFAHDLYAQFAASKKAKRTVSLTKISAAMRKHFK